MIPADIVNSVNILRALCVTSADLFTVYISPCADSRQIPNSGLYCTKSRPPCFTHSQLIQMAKTKKKTQSNTIALTERLGTTTRLASNLKRVSSSKDGSEKSQGRTRPAQGKLCIHPSGGSLSDRGALFSACQYVNPRHGESDAPQETAAAHKEISKLIGATERAGYTIVPLSLYWYAKSETQNCAGEREKTIRQTTGNQTTGLGQTETAPFQEHGLNRPVDVRPLPCPVESRTGCIATPQSLSPA